MPTTVRVRDARAWERGEEDLASRAAPSGCVAACVDGSECAEQVLPHAQAAAHVLDVPMVLIRVLEGGGVPDDPPDPFEWAIRQREAREYLQRLATERCSDGSAIPVALMEGQAAEEICLWGWRHETELIVLCTHGAGGSWGSGLGGTARKLIEHAPGSLLVVPSGRPGTDGVASYRRILVPLDGSRRAESVLPLARRLGAAHGAELVLAHVVPVPELTEVCPLSGEDIELRERVVRRNEHVATEYLDRLRASQAARGDPAPRVRVVRAADVRSRLVRLVAETGADLVVLAGHGRSERCDAPVGSVAAHLIRHARTPLWIVRLRADAPLGFGEPSRGERVRLPSQAAS